MPETPDFDHIATSLLRAIEKAGGSDRPVASTRAIADQLRQVWNARGAADIAKVEEVDAELDGGELFAAGLTHALRTLDR